MDYGADTDNVHPHNLQTGQKFDLDLKVKHQVYSADVLLKGHILQYLLM